MSRRRFLSHTSSAAVNFRETLEPLENQSHVIRMSWLKKKEKMIPKLRWVGFADLTLGNDPQPIWKTMKKQYLC
ncbi:unnamed protein product [Tenebrio molitor]|nr:unnamed protein product [Tenebrio molitor]